MRCEVAPTFVLALEDDVAQSMQPSDAKNLSRRKPRREVSVITYNRGDWMSSFGNAEYPKGTGAFTPRMES